jgi:hypothetical protein
MTPTYVLNGKTAAPEPDPAAWQRWMQAAPTDGSRVVAPSRIGAQLTVSTVFAGIDQGPSGSLGDPTPVLFETAVFKNGEQIHGDLYADWSAAKRGHAATVLKFGGAKPN